MGGAALFYGGQIQRISMPGLPKVFFSGHFAGSPAHDPNPNRNRKQKEDSPGAEFLSPGIRSRIKPQGIQKIKKRRQNKQVTKAAVGINRRRRKHGIGPYAAECKHAKHRQYFFEAGFLFFGWPHTNQPHAIRSNTRQAFGYSDFMF